MNEKSYKPRGQKPKKSASPDVARVFTWRLSGADHDRVAQAAELLGVSINSFIADAVMGQVNEFMPKRTEDWLIEEE